MSVPGDSSTQPRDRVPGSSRRTFMGRFVGGLAIAVPALRTLAGGKAAAATVVPFARCDNTYTVYTGHYCSSNPIIKSCDSKVGDPGWCIGEYDVYDANDGSWCRHFTDVEGTCIA